MEQSTEVRTVKFASVLEVKRYACAYIDATSTEEDIRRIATSIGIDESEYTKMELIEKLMKYKRSE